MYSRLILGLALFQKFNDLAAAIFSDFKDGHPNIQLYKVLPLCLLAVNCILVVYLVHISTDLRLDFRNEKPRRLFRHTIKKEFQFPRYYTTYDIIGRLSVYYALEIGYEIIQQAAALGLIALNAVDALPPLRQPINFSRATDDVTITPEQMQQPPSTGPLRYIVGLFVLSLLIIGLLLYDVAVCITIPVKIRPLLC